MSDLDLDTSPIDELAKLDWNKDSLYKILDRALDENKQLRVMVATCHAGAMLYRDDGELQDATASPHIDWKRFTISQIKGCLAQRAQAEFEKLSDEDKAKIQGRLGI